MQEFKQYLQHELNKLNAAPGVIKIKVVDNSGTGTNLVTLPGISTAELLQLLTKDKNL